MFYEMLYLKIKRTERLRREAEGREVESHIEKQAEVGLGPAGCSTTSSSSRRLEAWLLERKQRVKTPPCPSGASVLRSHTTQNTAQIREEKEEIKKKRQRVNATYIPHTISAMSFCSIQTLLLKDTCGINGVVRKRYEYNPI